MFRGSLYFTNVMAEPWVCLAGMVVYGAVYSMVCSWRDTVSEFSHLNLAVQNICIIVCMYEGQIVLIGRGNGVWELVNGPMAGYE